MTASFVIAWQQPCPPLLLAFQMDQLLKCAKEHCLPTNAGAEVEENDASALQKDSVSSGKAKAPQRRAAKQPAQTAPTGTNDLQKPPKADAASSLAMQLVLEYDGDMPTNETSMRAVVSLNAAPPASSAALRLQLVLDTSGSMAGSNIELLRHATRYSAASSK